MKKFYISIIINIALCTYLAQQKLPSFLSTQKISSKKQYRVAVIKPITHPSLDAIENGFMQTLKKESYIDFLFTQYDGNGDRTLMRSQAEDIISGDYDAALTIGSGVTQLIKEVRDKKGEKIPLFFAAVSNPEEKNILGKDITGAIEKTNIEQQLTTLLTLKPHTKKILLAYNPAQDSHFEKEKDAIREFCKRHNRKFESLEIYQTNEILEKVKPKLQAEYDAPDVLMILKDNTMVSSLEALVKMCNRSGITLFASDIDSPDRGAALGFGVTERSFGVHAAHMLREVFEKKRSLSEIPASPVTDFKIKFHEKALEKQGIHLDRNLLFIIKNGIVS